MQAHRRHGTFSPQLCVAPWIWRYTTRAWLWLCPQSGPRRADKAHNIPLMKHSLLASVVSTAHAASTVLDAFPGFRARETAIYEWIKADAHNAYERIPFYKGRVHNARKTHAFSTANLELHLQNPHSMRWRLIMREQHTHTHDTHTHTHTHTHMRAHTHTHRHSLKRMLIMYVEHTHSI